MMVFQGGQEALVIGYVKKKMFMVARWGFYGQYLPSLSINYVAIIKDLEKLASRLY